ncbi:MAG: aminopeptidase [Chloroflexota bacterium]|nr:aminopeptidase [Dehalococcoidia bacterium]MDW8252738.1 aminopeptidase [Chloroflexota bacterium]
MMDWAAIALAKTASWVVNEAAATQPGEQVLIVADHRSDPAVVQALTAAVAAVGAEPTVAVMPARPVAGAPATAIVQHAVDGATLVICPTTTVIHFSPRIRQALDEKRIRLISISIDRETMTHGAAAADPDEVAAITTRLYEVLAPARELRVWSANGTDFTCSVADRLPNLSIGRAREPGRIGTFPFGEVPHAPIEGSMNGVVVYDGPVHSIGHLTAPIRLTVRDGRVTAIEGGAEADQLRALIGGVENADVVAEVSIGTNPKANLAGDIQEAKKRWGTVHVGLGNSTGLRGRTFSPLHIDGLIVRPTVWADGHLIVREGQLLV